MPTNTDLVKDLPADFDIFGQAVDDRIKALNPETTAGDISYRGATANAKTRLAIGTANQVLAVNSGATAPEWKTISTGSKTLISRQTISAASSFSFTGISGSYTDLFIRWQGIYTGDTATTFALRLNNDSGSNYYNSAAAVYATSAQSQMSKDTYIVNGLYVAKDNNFTGDHHQQSMGCLTIGNYASTSLWKPVEGQFHFYFNSTPTTFHNSVVCRYGSASAITSIDIVRLSGTSTINTGTNGYIELWGIN